MKTFEEHAQDPEVHPWHVLGPEGNEATGEPVGWGRRLVGAIGRVLDVVWEHADWAKRVRFMRWAPKDALQHAVRDANVPTFLAYDTTGQIKQRVVGAWGFHERANTEAGYDELFALLGLDPDETSVLDRSNGPHWFTETWGSAFAIVSRNPLRWGARAETWDELEARGLTWAQLEALGESFDFTCPASLFSQLREFMWTRKWAHGVPVYFVCSFGPGHTWDSLLASGLTWDEVEATFADWDALADVERVVVIQTARIWEAMNLEDNNTPLTWDQLESLGVRWGRFMTLGS